MEGSSNQSSTRVHSGNSPFHGGILDKEGRYALRSPTCYVHTIWQQLHTQSNYGATECNASMVAMRKVALSYLV